MNHFKYIIFLIAAFNACCLCQKKKADKTFLRKETPSLWRFKERLINSLSRMYNYDVHGWVNVEKISGESLKQIDLILQDGKVICMKSNKVVPVKALSYKIKHEDSKTIYSEYIFEYVGVNTKEKLLNPIPVTIPKKPKTPIIKQNKVLPDNFAGYLVCEEKGSPASLIEHSIETLEFMTPPWRALVDIQLYRNPLAPYGRLYNIVVLDNVDILKNGKKSFFWPLPVSSMADVYAFQTAIEDSRKGKYCTLSRDSVTFNIELSCGSWKRSVANSLVNGFMFLGLLVMNASFGANLFYLKHKPLYTKTIPLLNGDTTVLYEKEEILRFAEEESERLKASKKKDGTIYMSAGDESSKALKTSGVSADEIQQQSDEEQFSSEKYIWRYSTQRGEDEEDSVEEDSVEEAVSSYAQASLKTMKAKGPATKKEKKQKKQKKEKEKTAGELALESFDKYYPYKDEDKRKTKHLLLFGNLIYLLGWGLLNGGWGITALIKMTSVLKRADAELKKAKLSTPWKLEYLQTKAVKPKKNKPQK